MTINREHLAGLELSREEINHWPVTGLAAAKLKLDQLIAQAQAAPEAEPVAWDWYNARRYGAPGERRHNVLWVDDYRRADGTTPDLDYLLESYRQGGDSGGITLHLKPLCYSSQHDAELVEDGLRLGGLTDVSHQLGMLCLHFKNTDHLHVALRELRAKLATLRHV